MQGASRLLSYKAFLLEAGYLLHNSGMRFILTVEYGTNI